MIEPRGGSLLVAVIACGLGDPTLVSAQVKARSLLEPATLSRPFNRITGLHELSDGRVVVVDANDESVLLGDFANDAAVQLGRKGSGPGEYRFPMRLLRLGGDSVGIEDGGNGRILVVTAKGRLSGCRSCWRSTQGCCVSRWTAFSPKFPPRSCSPLSPASLSPPAVSCW